MHISYRKSKKNKIQNYKEIKAAKIFYPIVDSSTRSRCLSGHLKRSCLNQVPETPAQFSAFRSSPAIFLTGWCQLPIHIFNAHAQLFDKVNNHGALQCFSPNTNFIMNHRSRFTVLPLSPAAKMDPENHRHPMYLNKPHLKLDLLCHWVGRC